MKKNTGQILILLAALIWGSSFIIMKSAVAFLTPALLLSIRFTMASIIMVIVCHKHLKELSKDTIIKGMITGIFLFLAYYFQTKGLEFTTPGKNAFLTAIYCAVVPFMAYFVFKDAVDKYHIIAAILCTIGIGFVSLEGNLSIQIGDFLTLIGGLLFSAHIIVVRKFSQTIHPLTLTTLQFIFFALCAIITTLFTEDFSLILKLNASVFLQLLYLAVFCTCVALSFQTLGQQIVNPCLASLLLSLEAVFGVVFSVLFYNEMLSLQVAVGFCIIFLAIIVSETKLSFLKRK